MTNLVKFYCKSYLRLELQLTTEGKGIPVRWIRGKRVSWQLSVEHTYKYLFYIKKKNLVKRSSAAIGYPVVSMAAM